MKRNLKLCKLQLLVNPLGPAEGQFCMCLYILQSTCTYNMIGTCLYTHDQCVCVCVLTGMQIRLYFISKARGHAIFNILDKYYHTSYYTLGASFPRFSLVIKCIFNILDHVNSCILSSAGTFWINSLGSFVTPNSPVEVRA